MNDTAPTPVPAGPPARRSRWRGVLATAALAGAGAVVGAGLATLGKHSEWLVGKLAPLSAWDLPVALLLLLVAIGVHELGHLAGGMRRGMRFLLLIVGPLRWTRTRQGIRFGWFFSPATFGGLAAALPDTGRPLTPQFRLLVIGGPAASLGLAVVCTLLAWTASGRIAAWSLLLALMSLAIFVATALPFHSRKGGFMSDGAQLLELRRGGTAVAQRFDLTLLMAQSLAGTRPRDLDPDALARLLAHAGDDLPMRRVAAHLFAYGHALDAGRPADARPHLEAVAAGIDEFPDGFRQSLALEVAWFRARHQGDLEGARQWLARGRGGVVEPGRREAAEAAIALLAGETGRAAGLARAGLAALPRATDAGAALATADQLQALLEEVRRMTDRPAFA